MLIDPMICCDRAEKSRKLMFCIDGRLRDWLMTNLLMERALNSLSFLENELKWSHLSPAKLRVASFIDQFIGRLTIAAVDLKF